MRRALRTTAGSVALLTAAAAAASAVTAPTMAVAAGTPATSIHRHFTEVEAGVQLSATGTRFEDTYKVKSSPFGEGSVIRDATLTGDTYPVSGKDTATSYYKDGRLTANETVTLGVPNIDGVGPVTGTGTCQGGTFKHQGETCTYTLKGTYDLITGQMFLTLTGTYTPAASSK